MTEESIYQTSSPIIKLIILCFLKVRDMFKNKIR